MANAKTPIVPPDGVLVVADNTGTPKTLTIPYHNGDLKIAGWTAGQKTVQEFLASGALYAVRKIEDKPLECEFTCDADHFLGDATNVTLFESMTQQGAWSSAVSQLTSVAGDGWVVKLTWTVERTNFGAAADNVVAMSFCVVESVDYSTGVPSKFSVKFKAWPRTPTGSSAITLT